MTNASKSPPDFVAAHIRDLPRSGIRDFFDLVTARQNVISLGIGEPDFVTPWHIREAAIYALERGATTYTANLGLADLRQAITRYVERSFKLSYDWKTEVLVTVGVSEALDLIVRAITSPGDEVLYHEPCFVAYAPLIAMAHARPVAVRTTADNGFRLNMEALEAARTSRTRALLINFPTNPTGGVMNRADAEAVADFVRRHDLLLITDEVYSELTYDVERISVAALPGMKSRTVFLNGLSKAWAMTGFRIGFACAPAPITEAMMKIHQYSMMCAPILSQRAAIEALDRGDEDIDHMRRSYVLRRNFICDALNRMGLDCLVPQGSFYSFPSISRTGLDSNTFSKRLLEAENVACVPGIAFGASGEGYLRCCYATDIELIKEAMTRMARFVAPLVR